MNTHKCPFPSCGKSAFMPNVILLGWCEHHYEMYLTILSMMRDERRALITAEELTPIIGVRPMTDEIEFFQKLITAELADGKH